MNTQQPLAGTYDTWPAHVSNKPRSMHAIVNQGRYKLLDQNETGRPQLVPKPRYLILFTVLPYLITMLDFIFLLISIVIESVIRFHIVDFLNASKHSWGVSWRHCTHSRSMGAAASTRTQYRSGSCKRTARRSTTWSPSSARIAGCSSP